MLVIHRNKNEALTLITPDGQHIKVLISSFQHGGVRVAVDAPSEVKIMRSELLEP